MLTGQASVWRTGDGETQQATAEVIRPFNACVKASLKPVIRNLYADGDTVIVFFDARGTARDDRPYVNTYAWFLVRARRGS